MRDRALWLLIPTFPVLVLGIVVVVALIAAQTLVMCLECRVVPEISLGVVFLPGVLVVSTGWGVAVGAATAVLSTAAFDFFQVPSALGFVRAVPAGSGGIRDLSVRRAAAQLCRGGGSVAGDRGRRPARGGRPRHGDRARGGGRRRAGRVRERVVASVQELLCAACEREGMGGAVER